MIVIYYGCDNHVLDYIFSISHMEAIMLNFKKIRLMTKLAVYEKKDGKEDIHLASIIKRTIRFQVLKSIITAS